MPRKIETFPSHPAQSMLFDRVVSILEKARNNVVRSVNTEMVIAYWLIGKEIVNVLQAGADRAGYGTGLIRNLSERLIELYGKGFSVPNLKLFRQFYLSFEGRSVEIGYTACSELLTQSISMASDGESEKATQCVANLQRGLHPNLGWSHYRMLMRVADPEAMSFYEREAAENNWSVRQLARQINSLFYERLLMSKDKRQMLMEAREDKECLRPVDIIKDPYVLEFLDIPESAKLSENDLENALISYLQDFLLELGAGFAFVGRQKRLTLDGDHFYPDLVFYHIKLKCYVIVDLKTGKLTHGDLGQMQMYVHYYDREIRTLDDNPTVGILLCAEKNDSVVRYVLSEENQQIFASKYRFALPTIEELKKELERERLLIEEFVTPDSKKSKIKPKKQRIDADKND
ncbi:MAG: PDDEXK nuclease domain-containing protein [Desulfomonilaceae bacterium]